MHTFHGLKDSYASNLQACTKTTMGMQHAFCNVTP